ncbi:NAD(P)-binding protein [Xylaria palmicola]|nr:NAD(P)-binding protein [Xylaria palmicola]
MNPVNTKAYQLPPDATWLITGCSSGIGRATAELVAGKPGQRLIATARDVASLSYLADDGAALKLALDVSSRASVEAAFRAAAAHFGPGFRLDVVVNNAGYELAGDTEAATEAEMHAQLETNFFGTVRVATHAASVMRGQAPSGGLIFNMSSLAGVAAFPGQSFYHASKFAVEGWSESFARELHPDWNINICLVEPGGVKTEFEHGSKRHTRVHEAYDGPDMPARQLAAWVRKAVEAGAGGVPPSAVAEALYRVASRGEMVPLWLPLTSNAARLIKTKLQARLDNLEAVKDLIPIERASHEGDEVNE